MKWLLVFCTSVLAFLLMTLKPGHGYADQQPVKIGDFYSMDGEIVQAKEIRPDRVLVIGPLGQERSVAARSLSIIDDYIAAIIRARGNLDRDVSSMRRQLYELQKLLIGQFDDAYLEMTVATLAALEGVPLARAGNPITNEREISLGRIAQNFTAYDVNKLIQVLNTIRFYESFLEFAKEQQKAGVRELEREIRWLRANLDTQDADRQRETRNNIEDKEREINVLQANENRLEQLRGNLSSYQKEVNEIQEIYFRFYEKTADMRGLYIVLRQKIAKGERLHDDRSRVQALATDWATALLKAETKNNQDDLAGSFAELQRRRQPPEPPPKPPPSPPPVQKKDDQPPPQSAPAGSRNESRQQDQGSGGGCFIATVVYGDYNHPDVIVLREIRDDFLSKSTWGNDFISFYYREGPAAAEWVAQRPFVAALVRGILLAFVTCIRHSALMLIILSSALCLKLHIRSRRKSTHGAV